MSGIPEGEAFGSPMSLRVRHRSPALLFPSAKKDSRAHPPVLDPILVSSRALNIPFGSGRLNQRLRSQGKHLSSGSHGADLPPHHRFPAAQPPSLGFERLHCPGPLPPGQSRWQHSLLVQILCSSISPITAFRYPMAGGNRELILNHRFGLIGAND